MNCKRIGKDVHISVDILIDGQIQSLDYGKITVCVRDKFGAQYMLRHKLETNRISAVFPGRQQQVLGTYSLNIEYDYNGETLFYDHSNAFALVKTTEEENLDTAEASKLGIFTHQLTSEKIDIL